MNRRKSSQPVPRMALRMCICLSAVLLVLTGTSVSQTFDLAWNTLDSGGVTPATGEGFALNATFAQSDAGDMSGQGYELRGGFWPGVAPVCACMADVNHDLRRDGRDVAALVACLTSDDEDCGCGDFDGSGRFDHLDVAAFTESLLDNGQCP